MTAAVGSALFVVGLVVGWPAVPIVAGVAIVAALRYPRNAIVGLALMGCTVAGAARGTAALADRDLPMAAGPHTGELISYARHTGATQRFVARTGGVRLCVTANTDLDLGRGDHIRFEGGVTARAAQAPSRAAALRQLGCAGTVQAGEIRVLRQGQGLRRRLDDERRDIADWFAETAPGDAGALLSGLVIGDDDALSFETRQGFYTLGMSHITAVSGSNLALLSWLLLGGAGRRRPLLLDVATLGILWLYVLLAGAGASSVRAGMTATLCVVVVRSGRRPDLLTVASIVAAAQVAFDPTLIGSLAYRLSTIAMLIMVSTLTGTRGDGRGAKFWSLVSCTVAIQLAVLPFSPNSDQAIVAGVVANVLAAPLVGGAFAAALAAAALRPISETVAVAVATVAELPTSTVLAIVSGLGQSRLAGLRPDALAWLPQQALRAGLLVGVAVAFGQHVRRGIGDLGERFAGASRDERLVWLGAVGGAALGVVAIALAR